MTIKRSRDSAGLLPDKIEVGGADLIKQLRLKEKGLIHTMFQAAMPAPRIERLRRHPGLRAKADELAAELQDGGVNAGMLHELLLAEKTALYLDTAPQVISDHKTKRQRSKAGFSSGKERRDERQPHWKAWQAAAEVIYRKNPYLSPSEIFRRVGAQFHVTRQAVSKRVHLPEK